MYQKLFLAVVLGFFVCRVVVDGAPEKAIGLEKDGGSEKIDEAQKDKLRDLLKVLKDKARKAKPVKYEVALPVATGGARGAQAKTADRFAVLWPTSSISPLTALAENLDHDAAQGKDAGELREQLTDFLKSFPEFTKERLLKDLTVVLSQPR